MEIRCRPAGSAAGVASLGGVRTLLAIAVAAPWVAWALLRTLGVSAGYPLVALIALRPTRR
jgi:hypothetical protein